MPASLCHRGTSGRERRSTASTTTRKGPIPAAASPQTAPSDADTNNVYEVEVTADDNTGNTTAQSINVTVDPVNDVPIATPDSYSLDQDSTLSVTAPGVLGNDLDVDGDSDRVLANWESIKRLEKGGAPRGALEAKLGDGAAAFLVGTEAPIATLVGAHLVSEPRHRR